MSEPSEMSNNPAADAARLAETAGLAEKLGRFTPDTSGLDRDALLFQAGQASVHPRRLWPMLAGFLALSQAATLLFFLTREPEQASPRTALVPKDEAAAPQTDPIVAPVSEQPRSLSYSRALLTGDLDDLPDPKTTYAAAAPDKVLTVRSMSSSSFD
jgi:hypothetical protein